MPITTIPVTLNISVALPEGPLDHFALVPPRAADPHAWHYTAAGGVADCGAPMLDRSHTLSRLEFSPNLLPATAELPPATAETHPASDKKDALIARLCATIDRIEDELTQVYEELERTKAALETARRAAAEANATPDADTHAGPEPSAPLPVAASLEPGALLSAADSDAAPLDETQPAQTDQDDTPSDVDGKPADADAGKVEVGDVTLDGVKISPKQRRAALLLAGGAKIADVAHAVGVERNTVQTWKREHTGFQAVLNSYSNDLQEAAQSRLLANVDCAVSVLANRVQQGDLAASVQLMKGLGMLTGKPRARACERADQLECNEM